MQFDCTCCLVAAWCECQCCDDRRKGESPESGRNACGCTCCQLSRRFSCRCRCCIQRKNKETVTCSTQRYIMMCGCTCCLLEAWCQCDCCVDKRKGENVAGRELCSCFCCKESRQEMCQCPCCNQRRL